tara:strand:- start:64 stop:219 length:156 start_codon:yes stop_codon:yes gene_type:complete
MGNSHFELKRFRTINPSIAIDKDRRASAQEPGTPGNGCNYTNALPAKPTNN